MIRRLFLGSVLLAGAALAQAASLPPAVNLQAEAKMARAAGYPLVILYSRQDCRYCEAVRREHLLPLTKSPEYGGRVVVRQIDQDKETPLLDFAGEKTTHAAFARRERIRFVPVVAFYGEQGKVLADPIIGARLPDFYNSYLDAALAKGQR